MTEIDVGGILDDLDDECVPNYDPRVEITIEDLRQMMYEKRGRSIAYSTLSNMLGKKVANGVYAVRKVKMASGKVAKAYRMVGKP